MWQTAPPITVAPSQRATLEAWLRAPSTPQSIATRARIVLLASEGLSNHDIARRTGTSRPTVLLWRDRFTAGGPAALTVIEAGAAARHRSPPSKNGRSLKRRCRRRPRGRRTGAVAPWRERRA